jgi:hypothetical protein
MVGWAVRFLQTLLSIPNTLEICILDNILNNMKYIACPMLKKPLSFTEFYCFHKNVLGDGLIALVVVVVTTAEVKQMPPPTSRKPLSLR